MIPEEVVIEVESYDKVRDKAHEEGVEEGVAKGLEKGRLDQR